MEMELSDSGQVHYYHGGIVVAWVLPHGHELGLVYLKQII
jgi:hypothetical protein